MTTNRAAPAVVVDGVSKEFRLPSEQVHTLKETVLHPLRRSAHNEFRALDDVSFAVEHGEFLGIVGRNGSGKSTLLKCMAGIYRVDGGAIYIDGRLSAFIELGVGFNPDLPARDNVLINATMLGLSPREAKRRYDSVLDFAELRDFAHVKIKNYSSGMLVRLAFAVMVHVDADILLIDEVLAVGDAAFQQKCFDQFYRLRDEGRTVILVTHDMGAVERFCDRAILLEQGHLTHEGDPHRVGMRYLQANFRQMRQAQPEPDAEEPDAPEQGEQQAEAEADAGTGPEAQDAAEQAHEPDEPATEEPDEEEELRFGDGRAAIEAAWFEDAEGAVTEVLPSGEACAFVARARFSAEVVDPLFGFTLENARHDHVLAASTLWSDPRPGTFRGGEQVTFRIAFDNVLAPGRYDATPAIADRGSGIAWIDRRERFASVIVTSTRGTDAIVDLPYEVVLERGA